VNPATLLATLRERGVTIEAHGDQVRIAPKNGVSTGELNALRQRKAEVLDLLRAEDAGSNQRALVVDAVACTPMPVAWRLHSRRLSLELWVVRDAHAAIELDRDGARAGLPVVLADDLERLRAFDDQRLRDVLDVLAVFPGSRVAALDPEAAS
jgi:hypothetical protein